MTEQEQLEKIASALTPEELSELAAGKKMTEEQRKKIKLAVGIGVPVGAATLTAIALGATALAGKFGKHEGDKSYSYYFEKPFGVDGGWSKLNPRNWKNSRKVEPLITDDTD